MSNQKTKWALLVIALIAIPLDRNLAAQDGQMHGASTDAMWGYKAPATYHVLPAPPKSHPLHRASNKHAGPAVQLQSRPTDAYAYGWFGSQPAPQWSRQFGNRNAYTQWTLK
ncbi:MAG: hypothetical protein ACOVQM_12415 [Pirellula sp.]|jgi:hypothetical protein